MTQPNSRQAFLDTPERFGLSPVGYWCAFSISVAASIVLLCSLAYLSIATICGWVRDDRPLFISLNAIWIYVGTFALLAILPGLTTLVRSTFAVTNFGWYAVIATGLPIWGPVILWCFGRALPTPARWPHADGQPWHVLALWSEMLAEPCDEQKMNAEYYQSRSRATLDWTINSREMAIADARRQTHFIVNT
ncbi:hypothetical protein [Stieleria sp. JC731]|uniref:hypothetical protein n=1 Tax=Stieleria sp. JC731 TaxID=2894195 RepID=UPI001E500CA1|nr:hypothetical protein [Stieleria sp. JC731]